MKINSLIFGFILSAGCVIGFFGCNPPPQTEVTSFQASTNQNMSVQNGEKINVIQVEDCSGYQSGIIVDASVAKIINERSLSVVEVKSTTDRPCSSALIYHKISNK